jgi:P4 family phage/plasmid primase-like protien
VSDQRYLPEVLFENGFTDLISVVPPGATISPGSKLVPSQLGKVPGRRNKNGTWAGYPWQQSQHSVDDVRQWMIDGANVGMRADNFPGVDIDSEDQVISDYIQMLAEKYLGPAPVRYGRRPKRLMMYATDVPFGRLRAWITKGEDPEEDGYEKHLVEVLGTGQQYLVYGTHPSGANYEWTEDMREYIPDRLTFITRELALAFREAVKVAFEGKGYNVEYEGEGVPSSKLSLDQQSLRAPSLDAVYEAMEHLPNDHQFDAREDWLKVAYALRAACGVEGEHDAREMFLAWSLKWPKGNDAGRVISEFNRCVGPYKIGWPWLLDKASEHGYFTADQAFDALPALDAPADVDLSTLDAPDDAPATSPRYSDVWLAEEVVKEHGDVIRYASEDGKWYVWTGKTWEKDLRGKALELIKGTLCRIAMDRRAVGDRKAVEESKAIASNGKKNAVESLLKHAPGVAIALKSFDADPWLLNTPDGIVDLRSGQRMAPDPALLCSKLAGVAPDFGGPCPEWRRFLSEATKGDETLQAYLQRYAGYCLTGATYEQQFSVLYGQGGNGKGTFRATLEAVLGEYAVSAKMDTFVEKGNNTAHSTDIASFAGARLVSATEVNPKQRLDPAKLKELSGQDRIQARFLYQDNFNFEPQFKLLLQMNNPPALGDNSMGMQRRLHLVPFTNPPAVVDNKLRDKLAAEYPAILAWMIEGCLSWQKEGLTAPPIVRNFTEEHFEREDIIARFLSEKTVDAPGAEVRVLDLWHAYNEWASAEGVPTSRASNTFARDLRGYHLDFSKNFERQAVILNKSFASITPNMGALP